MLMHLVIGVDLTAGAHMSTGTVWTDASYLSANLPVHTDPHPALQP